MTRFYLIRHADIIWGPGDPGLSALGRAQAAAVGQYLKSRPVSQVYTSPLLRARQTGAIIAQAVGAPVQVDLRLRERMNWGDVAGQTWAQFESEWSRASRNPDYLPPGGLSVHQAAAQMEDFLKEMAFRYPEESLAAVAHAGILRDYLSEHFLPAELDRLSLAWKAHQGEAITHCSVTTLCWEGGQAHLESLAVVVPPIENV